MNTPKHYTWRIDSSRHDSNLTPQTFCHTADQVEKIVGEHQKELPRSKTVVTCLVTGATLQVQSEH